MSGGEHVSSATRDFVPLLQTLLWIGFFTGLAVVLRREIKLIRQTLAQRLERGVAFELGPVKIGELKQQIASVQYSLSETDARMRQLILLTISKPMFENLKKIVNKDFKDYEMTGGLKRELYHLRDIGYVEIDSIAAIPPRGDNLMTYVRPTETGELFVRLRGEAGLD